MPQTPSATSGSPVGHSELSLAKLAATAVSDVTTNTTNANARGVMVVIDITAITGTTPTLTVVVQGFDPLSGKYFTLLASAALNAVATTLLTIYPGAAATANVSANLPLPKTWRISWTIAGTTPAVTATIGAIALV